jgi:hypothetical protein
MRTTINLPDALLAKAKKFAADSGGSLTSLIQDSLREALARRQRKPAARRVELTTFGKKGLQPGVDLDDTRTLLDLTSPPRVTRRR